MQTFKHYFFYLLLMFCCQNVFAEVVAKVIFAQGETYLINKAGKQLALKKNSTLEQGDTIITQKGTLQLRFTDGGIISFYDNTEFKIDNYHFSEKADGKEKAFFYFVKGVFRTIVGSIKKERYQVKTNIAAIGTRGTKYLAKLGNTLQVDVFEGTVILKNQAGDFAITSGHSALMSDILSMPEFIKLENRNYNQLGDRNGQFPEKAGEHGGETRRESHNEPPPINDNPHNNKPPAIDSNSQNNNRPPRNREHDGHRQDVEEPSVITIENILNGTISIEEGVSLPPPQPVSP